MIKYSIFRGINEELAQLEPNPVDIGGSTYTVSTGILLIYDFFITKTCTMMGGSSYRVLKNFLYYNTACVYCP